MDKTTPLRSKTQFIASAIIKKIKNDNPKARNYSVKVPHRAKYLASMERLLSSFEKSKIKKLTNEVKNLNIAFQ